MLLCLTSARLRFNALSIPRMLLRLNSNKVDKVDAINRGGGGPLEAAQGALVHEIAEVEVERADGLVGTGPSSQPGGGTAGRNPGTSA